MSESDCGCLGPGCGICDDCAENAPWRFDDKIKNPRQMLDGKAAVWTPGQLYQLDRELDHDAPPQLIYKAAKEWLELQNYLKLFRM